mmetsp:Transcript_25977/g.50926  ORF Transcript_25977/g.50926 Transcript_25977/m.50926 type:complete len:147 (+) Transcript_25977:418-858(+)
MLLDLIDASAFLVNQPDVHPTKSGKKRQEKKKNSKVGSALLQGEGLYCPFISANTKNSTTDIEGKTESNEWMGRESDSVGHQKCEHKSKEMEERPQEEGRRRRRTETKIQDRPFPSSLFLPSLTNIIQLVGSLSFLRPLIISVDSV